MLGCARPGRGLTLIEMVISIAALGVLAAAAALFLRGPIASFFDTERRAGLADTALLAAARLRLDMASAVPNSVRVLVAGGRVYIELLPTRLDAAGLPSQGRYRGGGPGDSLTVAAPDTRFDVLGADVNAAFRVTVQPGDWIVVNNHAAGANVWATNSTRAAYTGPGGSVQTVDFATHTFPFDSAERRFQVATNPVTYVCDPVAGQLRRIDNYGPPAVTQPVAFGAAANNRLLAENVRFCRAVALPGNLRRAQRLAVEFRFETAGERVTVAQTLRGSVWP